MTKIVNLDKLATKRDKVVVLGGVEHPMKNLTVQDYVQQMKATQEIQNMVEEDNGIETTEKIMNLTIQALMFLFPTITKEQFESLNMDQLSAIRQLADEYTGEDAPEPTTTGE